MPTIADLRKDHPRFADLSDEEVVKAVSQDYPDLSSQDVATALGVKMPDPPPMASRGLGGFAKDIGASLMSGAVSVPETAVGAADMVSGGAAGKALSDAGIDLKGAHQYWEDKLSDQQKADDAAVGNAHGVVDIAQAALTHPTTIAKSVIESLPAMATGGLMGRAVMGLGPLARAAGEAAPKFAGAVGEGMQMMTQDAEQMRQETSDGLLTPGQVGHAAAIGVMGAGTSLLGGGIAEGMPGVGNALSNMGLKKVGEKVAKGLGIHDIDTMIAAGKMSDTAGKGIVRRVLEGAMAEGLLEELPQSVMEQVLQNHALGKPLDEGVDNAAVMGALSGGAMGAGANLHGGHGHADPKNDESAPGAHSIPLLPAPTITVGADGTAATADQRQQQRQDVQDVPFREVGPLSRAAGQAAAAAPTANVDPGKVAEAVDLAVKDEAANRPTPADQLQQQVDAEKRATEAPPVDDLFPPPANDAAHDRDKAIYDDVMAQSEPAAAPAAAAPAPTVTPGTVDEGAHESHSSPLNDKAGTDSQILANNAPLGHVKVGGLDISVENADGSTRSDKHNTPPQWSTPMQGVHYGYFRGTVAADSTAGKKQGVDVFLRAGTPTDYAGPVYVVDQIHQDGSNGFDEHKVMLGFNNRAAAVQAYKRHYSAGWKLGRITEMPFDQFKGWLKDGDTTKPASPKGPMEATSAAATQQEGAAAPAVAGAVDAAPAGAAAAAAAPAVEAAGGDKQRWLTALANQNRIQKPGAATITGVVNGRASFQGDPSRSKEGRALLGTYEEAVKAGATPEEIHAAVTGASATAPVASQNPAEVTDKPASVQPAAHDENAHGSRWTRMTEDQRRALVGQTKAKPGAVQKVPRQPWENLSPGWQSSLAKIMDKAPAAPQESTDESTKPTPAADAGGKPNGANDGTHVQEPAAARPADAGKPVATGNAAETAPIAPQGRADDAAAAPTAGAGPVAAPVKETPAERMRASLAKKDAARAAGAQAYQSDADRVPPDEMTDPAHRTAWLDGYDNAAPAPAPRPPKADKKHEALLDRLAEHFMPGNVVKSYAGHDRVIQFKRQDERGGWSVQVHAAVKRGDTWVDDPKDNRDRWHSTQPDERELAAGPVQRGAAPVANYSPTDEALAAARADLPPGYAIQPERASGSPTANTFTVKRPDGTTLVAGFNRTQAGLEEGVRHAKMDAEKAAPAPAPAPPVSSNTVFTDDMAAKAREILRKKLGTAMSGIDPELLHAGITLAGWHIEKGARTFAAYSKAMLADLGDTVRPFLKSWYMAIQFDPRAAEFSKQMNDPGFVAQFNVDDIETPKAPEAKTETAPAPEKAGTLVDHFAQQIKQGNIPEDNPALRRMVQEYTGKEATPADMKAGQEAFEAAVVQVAREVVAKKDGDKSTFAALLRIYQRQPNLNVRTSTSVENQAYSTPAPLAFLASRLAGIDSKARVLEPTAGTGMLLMGANPKTAIVNELNPDRAALLEAQGFKVTQDDATTHPWAADSADAVITNPPFGSVKDDEGKTRKEVVDGYKLGQIDHVIAARALAAMKDDGKAALILGANKVEGGLSEDDRIFFNWLYSHYNVASHFEVDGKLYARQGASWPVRVIAIEGRKAVADNAVAPAAGTIERFDTWEKVYGQYEQALAASGQDERGAAPAAGRPDGEQAGSVDVSGTAGQQVPGAGGRRPRGGTSDAGAVAGAGAGTVGAGGAIQPGGLGQGTGAVGRNDATAAADRLDPAGQRAGGADGQPAGPANRSGNAGLADAENQFQAKYVPRSERKDEGILIPVNMAQPLQEALDTLEDNVGNIDEFAARELGYKSTDEMHSALMGLQVDSVASAIYQIKERGKAIIIADQTGIGKGRQAAAMIRWAVKNGKVPVFVTVKPALFTDMHVEDLRGIGADGMVKPFIMNVGEEVKDHDGTVLFSTSSGERKRALAKMAGGEMPTGHNAVFMTYSQINVENAQRGAIQGIAPNAVFILDESHNAGGDSNTGEFVKGALELAHGTVYLSATYAKRPDNMPLYFKTDMGEAVADDDTLMDAMAAGGLPLQTVVSNNLVKAGQMFRRERSYDGVEIRTTLATDKRAEHVKLSDETTKALRAIVAADRMFHATFIKSLKEELAAEGASVLDGAGNQAQRSVDHTQFSSVVHNFVRQMLLGLNAQSAAEKAVEALKAGKKPLIALENTMGSFLSEYAANNNLRPGDPLGDFSYRTVLSRALDRSRYYVEKDRQGNKTKVYVSLDQLDPQTRATYDEAQSIIDSLDIDVPVSPIDWMRQHIANAGHTVAEITGRDLRVDYSDPKKPRLEQVDQREQDDKTLTTRRFNGLMAPKLDAIILNVAGSTGISLHASEKFTDQSKRKMIVAQAAQDINIFMQMLGRIHRTGQVTLPEYEILNPDLPATVRPTALLSRKMKSLNANTSSNTESATSVEAVDMLNKYGDEVVGQYLADNPELSRALGIDAPLSEDGKASEEDLARKATGRLALMPVAVQEQFYEEVGEQYRTMLDYLNRTNQNELEPRTYDFDAKELKAETIFSGTNPESPFGQDATYGEYSVKAQGKPLTPEEIKAQIAEALKGQTAAEHLRDIRATLDPEFQKFQAGLAATPELAERAGIVRANAIQFLQNHAPGDYFRVDINGDSYNAVVTNLRSTHKKGGNPYSMSKIQVTVALNGALRSVTVPATKFSGIEVSTLPPHYKIESLFQGGRENDRETAKIITGNLLGAYGELQGTRGTIVSFTKQDGSTEQGILLPKAFALADNTKGGYRLASGADALRFLHESGAKNIEQLGIATRDNVVRVLPFGANGIELRVPKSKAKGGKYFLNAELRAELGDFYTRGNAMVATTTDPAKAARAIDVVMKKQAVYALDSMKEAAQTMFAHSVKFDKDGKPQIMQGDKPAFRQDASTQSTLPTDAQRVAQLQQTMDGITEAWARKPDVVVLESVASAAAPPEVRREARKLIANGGSVPSGVYFEGRVYLFADRIGSDKQAAEVLFHEVLGHMGLRGAFRGQLDGILRQIAAARPADIAKIIKRNGFAETDRLRAAEEFLAEMAQTTPELGFVRRAVAAIRTFLRQFFPKMELTDDEIVRNFILPARAYITDGKPGGPKGGAPVPVFSQAPAAHESTPMFSQGATGVNSPRDFWNTARGIVDELAHNPGQQMNWWQKTFGTPYDLAQRHPRTFGVVYNRVQQYLRDVSAYATEAADLAPRILPKLDNWKDAFKSPLKAEDAKAIQAPVFEGTLVWARDTNGKPIKATDLEARYAALDSHQKASLLKGGDHISEDDLKALRRLPIDAYEAAVNSKFEQAFTQPGIVWKDEELRSMFKLTDDQIGLYREARAAIDKSLTNLVLADMVRYAGKDAEPIADAIMETGSLEAGSDMLRDYLLSLEPTGSARSRTLTDIAAKAVSKALRGQQLMDRGYAPLSRFGNHVVDVTENGQRVYFGLFESRWEARAMAAKMRAQFPEGTITRGTTSQDAYKLFAGITPETAELFGEMLGLEADGDGKANAAFQSFLKEARSSRSAMKRLIERKGIAGFSDDVGRVLAGFVYSNARQTASGIHAKGITAAANNIPQGQGELKDMAVRLTKYVTEPQDEAVALRGVLFAQYLGGNIASMLVNMTQPFVVTAPYLTQFDKVGKVAGFMKGAVADAWKGDADWKKTDPRLGEALRLAAERGDVAPQEVHQLMRQAAGRASLSTHDGTPTGRAKAMASNLLSRATHLWGQPFAVAELFNRRVTFIAAYRLAVARGIADPAGFAVKAINDTQFVYNKGNKPQWARGAVGALLFTFKQYSVSYLELVHRMYTQGGPQGKKSALMMLAMLMLAGGAGGLPFEDDIIDLIDGIGQRLGYNLRTKHARQQFLEDHLGKAMGGFMDKGVTGLPGMPFDLAGRFGMGNLIPGTGLLVEKKDHTQDVMELAGPAGEFAKRGFQAADQIAHGNVVDGALTVAPTSIRNLQKAYDMETLGYYPDAKGRKVVETDGGDVLAKAIGFQPSAVSDVQDASRDVQQLKEVAQMKESEIADSLAMALLKKDPTATQSARDAITRWNRDNPDSPITIKQSAIMRRVREMNKTKAQRLESSSPKGIRAEVHRELLRGGE